MFVFDRLAFDMLMLNISISAYMVYIAVHSPRYSTWTGCASECCKLICESLRVCVCVGAYLCVCILPRKCTHACMYLCILGCGVAKFRAFDVAVGCGVVGFWR